MNCGWQILGRGTARAERDGNSLSCRKCGEMLSFIRDGINKQQALWCLLGQLVFQMYPPGKSGHSPQMCLCEILFPKHRTRALCLQGAQSQTDGLWGCCHTCLSGQVKAGKVFFQRQSGIPWDWFFCCSLGFCHFFPAKDSFCSCSWFGKEKPYFSVSCGKHTVPFLGHCFVCTQRKFLYSVPSVY